MKIFLTLLIALFLFQSSKGQDSNPIDIKVLEDSLKLVKGSQKALLLNKLCDTLSLINPKLTLKYAKEGLEIAKKGGVKNQVKASLYRSLGTAYYYLKDYFQAVKYYKEEMLVLENMKKYKSAMQASINMANIAYNKQYDVKNAIVYYEKTIKLAKLAADAETQQNCRLTLTRIYSGKKDYKKALENYQAYVVLRDLDMTSTHQKTMVLVRDKYDQEVQKKTVEIKEAKVREEILVKDTVKKSEKIVKLDKEKKKTEEELFMSKIILFLSLGFLLVVAAFSLLLNKQFRAKKRAYNELEVKNIKISMQKKELEEQRDEILLQKNKITKQNDEITASIRYASRIQNAILPPLEQLSGALPDHFIFFKPRELVSGDFYWMSKKGDYIAIVAADCTGHGVPGAMMSMLGVSYLNEISNKIFPTENSDQVLNLLRENIKIMLHQKDGRNSETKDGMDISLCILNQKTKKLYFSGAHNSAYLIRKDATGQYQSMELKADKMPIGVYAKKEEPFTKQVVDLMSGDSIYLYSDGYMDQFGGDNDRKYTKKKFLENILTLQNTKMADQKTIIENNFESWRSEPGRNGAPYQQMDDVLIIGFKVS